MEKQTPKVKECAKMAAKITEQAYPAYGDAVEATSEADMQAAEEGYTKALALYYPIMYALDGAKPPMNSVCKGPAAGKPVVGTASECAKACDDMVHPVKCIGFQF